MSQRNLGDEIEKDGKEAFSGMNVIKILVCDPIHEDGIEMMRMAGFQVDLKIAITHDELIEMVGNYDALVVRSQTNVTEDVLSQAGKLKVVARAGVGLDNIDLEGADRRGINIINSPEASSNAVAELVIGLMFSLARRIPEADASMKRGEWIKSKLKGSEISGKTLGIIGFGRIGYLVAKKAKACGMKVLTYDVIIEKLMDFLEEAGAEAVSLEKLLSSSDYITIHVPLFPQTRHMIGREEIGMMKTSACIINAARGAVIDEEALREALTQGRLAGAALDVFEEEPPADTKLTGLRNVVCTPHIGAATEEAQRANSTIIADKLIKLLT